MSKIFQSLVCFIKHFVNWFENVYLETGEMIHNDQIVISRDTLSALMINSDSYSPRTIVLQRGKKGFGFVLRGSRGKHSNFCWSRFIFCEI